MRKFGNKLIVRLLIAIAISFFVSLGMMSLIIFSFYKITGLTNVSVRSSYVTILIEYFAALLTFIAVFLLLVRKKISYLKRITESVHHIANGKLGLTIRIESRDELTQLAQHINYMSEELESKFEHERELERAKSELISNVSHDLRTPLTSIIGYLDLLKKEQYNSKAQFQEYLETIYSKSQRLKYLIDELFEYTHLSSPDVILNRSKTDLSALLEQITGEYIPMFEKEQLTVRKSITEEHVPVCIDIEKMVRVYDNLFMNALKYSIKPSEFFINLELKDEKAILQVSNKAEIPADDINQLFERFFRGDKARTGHQGTGLGLAISKRIVELHSGRIHADYSGGWLRFTVEHPID
ncbi:HAMP domain-containing sensor histidine kinase [Bacillus velezensis]|uniref:sensor histidine kinase n=1 Tax=Bacillus TaxID=1386 RepID=UPI0011B5A48B|nr:MULTISPECIES: HAMP domain-containing sensor histidine kinase [Bacillus amyloliquefaciens group]MEC3630538.1 HAMP domain-containing sensor histidine kinase [Bacillus velezensis]QGJ63807.1 HAMP domain-containing histidine kinase [Bacillus velezensis]